MDFALATEFSPSAYRYHPELHHSDKSAPNLVAIVQQLHESLDPRTVFACFGKIMGQYLPVCGIKLQTRQYQLSWGSELGIQIKQRVSLETIEAQLDYRLTSPLLASQSELFTQIQTLLLRPLLNAIEYDLVSKQAMYDALTELGNRRYYDINLKQALARQQRHGERFSLILLDLDNFKSLNDQHGHLLGDDILRLFAKTLSRAIRESEQAYRIGGDEFAILIEGDDEAASVLCQRILSMVKGNLRLNKFQIQTSLGVAQSVENDSPIELFCRADKALYQAKAAGRCCYRIYEK
ncbi:GGDEF domain-containing protein [Shewanella sp. AS1]|uniref:diguanylate cyclase DgcS n=1 Tax=Shewanella sp. AS1 TaxID=2907626 RepID=UPI001F3B8D21|nr:GGDEF domain-containing protein [Shewanella sp. AS1]MCE9678179.1 GGDEF domain-containing protein [Shewanella sp. AS1]